MHDWGLCSHTVCGTIGLPQNPTLSATLDRGFMDSEYHVTKSGCWVWNGRTNAKGYGIKSVGGKTMLAHRWYFRESGAELIDGMVVHHRCGEKLCVNPKHLKQMRSREHNSLHRALRDEVNARMQGLYEDERRRTVYHIQPVDPRRVNAPRPRTEPRLAAPMLAIIERLRSA